MKRLVIKSDEERFVLSEVWFTSKQDTQEEFTDLSNTTQLAHRFLMQGGHAKIDRQHDRKPSENRIAESFIVRGKNDPDGFAEGAWVIGAYILNDEDWERVKKGEWNGFSWSGTAASHPVLCKVDHPIKMVGKTEQYPPTEDQGHTHSIETAFDADGAVIPSMTGPASNNSDHTHQILKTTATEAENDHSHRIVVES